MRLSGYVRVTLSVLESASMKSSSEFPRWEKCKVSDRIRLMTGYQGKLLSNTARFGKRRLWRSRNVEIFFVNVN